jgi:putative membrane protein
VTPEISNRRIWIELAVALAGSLALAVGSPYPDMMPLQHAGTLLVAAWIAWGIARGTASASGSRCLMGFMLLHAFAARWIYSYVPYDDWARALTGHTLSEAFGWRRNHFDRLVHLLFGVLVSPRLMDGFRLLVARPRSARLLVVQWVAAASLAYELFEWGLTMFLSADDAEGYNGQQGDPWDAHKDMALAVAGSALWAVAGGLRAIWWRRYRPDRDE